MPVQKFRARMKRQKYDPETDPDMIDEYGEYFAKAADEEQDEGKSHYRVAIWSQGGGGALQWEGKAFLFLSAKSKWLMFVHFESTNILTSLVELTKEGVFSLKYYPTFVVAEM